VGDKLGLIGLGPGIGQQSQAVQTMLAKASGARGGRTTQRRRKKKAASAGGARKRKRKSSKVARLKKGSAAAKAWMAKIRKKRKK